MDTGKSLLGIIGGVAIGVVLGVLFAPDKGSKTRKKLSLKKQEYSDDVTEKFHDLIKSMNDQFEKIKDEMKFKYDNGKADAKDASVKEAVK